MFDSGGGSHRVTAIGDIEVRLARTRDEVDAAQRLRYAVFYEEWGAHAKPHMRQTQREVDGFDAAMDHLIVIDHTRPHGDGQVVGNYRLQRGDRLDPRGRFYSSREFDLDGLLASDQKLLELGRSCVLHEYRRQPILQLMWRAITGYVAEHGIDVMFVVRACAAPTRMRCASNSPICTITTSRRRPCVRGRGGRRGSAWM